MIGPMSLFAPGMEGLSSHISSTSLYFFVPLAIPLTA